MASRTAPEASGRWSEDAVVHVGSGWLPLAVDRTGADPLPVRVGVTIDGGSRLYTEGRVSLYPYNRSYLWVTVCGCLSPRATFMPPPLPPYPLGTQHATSTCARSPAISSCFGFTIGGTGDGQGIQVSGAQQAGSSSTGKREAPPPAGRQKVCCTDKSSLTRMAGTRRLLFTKSLAVPPMRRGGGPGLSHDAPVCDVVLPHRLRLHAAYECCTSRFRHGNLHTYMYTSRRGRA